MFLLVILACIALAHGSYPYAQPYRFGYAIRDHQSQQYREEAGNGVGAVAGRYGYADGRGNIQYNNYGVGAGYGVPVYGYGIGGYGLGYGGYGLGYGVYGLGNIGYGYGSALGYNALLGGYGDVYYGTGLV